MPMKADPAHKRSSHYKYIWPRDDHDPAKPLQDLALENFCHLVAAGVSKRAAVLRTWPMGSQMAASARASTVLQYPAVRARLAFLVDHPNAPAATMPRLNAKTYPEPAPVDQPPTAGAAAAELSPKELRGIIAEGCRSSDPQTKRAAIAQALKLYDATPKAADPVADPARLVEFLACGGGGQETLAAVMARLTSIYGVSAMRSAALSIIVQPLPTGDSQASTPQYIVV